MLDPYRCKKTSPRAVRLLMASAALAPLIVASSAWGECKTCVVSKMTLETPQATGAAQVSIEDPARELLVGELYYAVDENGRQTALIAITDAMTQPAAASLIKGTVTPGEAILLRTPSKLRKAFAKEDSTTQAEQGKNWRFGLGVSFFTLSGIGSIDGNSVSPGLNIMLAARIEYEFKPSLRSRLALGLQYYQGGISSGSSSSAASGISESLTLNYLGLPLTYKYVFYRGTDTNWLVKGGPMISQLLSSQYQIGNDQVSLNKSNVITANRDFMLTAGIEFMTLPSAIWVDVTVDYGLVNVGGPATDSTTMYNFGAILMAGKGF